MRSLLLPLAAVLASCGNTATVAAPPTARPALWKVSDPDTTVYLFGTIHLLPKDLAWQSPRVTQAIGASSSLILETVLDDPAAAGAAMATLAVSPGQPPLLDRVPPATRAALQRVVEKSGVPLTALDRMESWAAALTLAATSLRELPVSSKYGAEAVLTERFRSNGRAVSGLETPVEQLGYFDALSETAQREFLVSIAQDDSDAKKEFDAMIAAWTSGDVRRIAVTFDDEFKTSAELSDRLIRQRNVKWTDWIAERMAAPGTVFVAVGAGHLAGASSVDGLLRARGLKVQRLQ